MYFLCNLFFWNNFAADLSITFKLIHTMKKRFFLTIALSLLLLNAYCDGNDESSSNYIQIELTCSKIDDQKTCPEFHRSSVRVPEVYYDSINNTLYFPSPCYDTELAILNQTNGSIEYSTLINGESVVLLPMYLQGQYEFTITRGNYCFSGIIDITH